MSAGQFDIALVTLTIEFAIAFVGLSRDVLGAQIRRVRLNLS
jgi:hypothetical protein